MTSNHVMSSINRKKNVYFSPKTVEETGVPGKKHWPVASHWHTLLHNAVLSTPHQTRIRTHNVSGDRYW
jgi:hypothetical protein